MTLLKTGSTGAGSLTQLIATGALNNYLTANASFTFWRVKYNKHTQFSMESIYQDFNSVVQFGREANLTLNRNGDLVYFCYVAIQLEGIEAKATISQEEFDADKVKSDLINKTDENDDPVLDDDGEPIKIKNPAKVGYEGAYDASGNSYGVQSLQDPESCVDYFDDGVSSFAGKKNEWAHYVNDIGQFLVQEAKFHIGGSEVDKLYSDYLFCWEELSGRSGRRLIEMVGKRFSRADLICDSKKQRVLYVPLPWYFTMHSGQALSLASLQFHSIQMSVTFAPLNKCVVASNSDVDVLKVGSTDKLQSTDLMAGLETTYIFLDVQERDKFSTSSYEVLVTQVQRYTWEMQSSTPSLTLPFNHPVIELIWFVRQKQKKIENNHFNYSGIEGGDPMLTASLLLNNQTRFSEKPGHYFRTVVPYERHSNIPESFIYNYSFALHPEDPSPSGTCNFSRIDNVNLRLELTDELGTSAAPVEVVVFARSFNVLRFKDGLGGIGFAN
jgi:hypothetical protein